NECPWFGALPRVGAAFRYRTENQFKRELLVILTPHVVRCEADNARVLADEARRMDWILKEVEAFHGQSRPPALNSPPPPVYTGQGLVPAQPPDPGIVLPTPQPVPVGPIVPTPPSPPGQPYSSAAPQQQAVMPTVAALPSGPAPLIDPFAPPAPLAPLPAAAVITAQ